MPGLAELVSVLVRHDVRFIIVGGMAGALQGAPVNTLDLDMRRTRGALMKAGLLRHGFARHLGALRVPQRSRCGDATLGQVGFPAPTQDQWDPIQ